MVGTCQLLQQQRVLIRYKQLVQQRIIASYQEASQGRDRRQARKRAVIVLVDPGVLRIRTEGCRASQAKPRRNRTSHSGRWFCHKLAALTDLHCGERSNSYERQSRLLMQCKVMTSAQLKRQRHCRHPWCTEANQNIAYWICSRYPSRALTHASPTRGTRVIVLRACLTFSHGWRYCPPGI